MLSQKKNKSAQTEGAAPIVFAANRDGIIIFCVDYRKRNTLKNRVWYPILWGDECIDSPGEAAILSIYDANIVYWQGKIDGTDKNETAFTAHCRLVPLSHRLIELQKAFGTFQCTKDVIVSKAEWQFDPASVYNIVVLCKPPREHICHARTVTSLLRNTVYLPRITHDVAIRKLNAPIDVTEFRCSSEL